tara:strand:+ start:3572 stop:10054 length:6483 start_codon:yes stop_codon:yes gene_type:complete
MAKKKSTPDSKSSPRNAPRKPKFTSSSVRTNSFTKGMNKDIAQSLELNNSWWHARNAANNDNDGDVGLIGNEPANLQCGVIPYTVIGAIHRYGDEWVVYSTDNINSEIGRFDDSECKYTTIVNDQCLNFKKEHLITGAAKENFDCTWEVYWDDNNNPSRSLNIDNVPYIKDYDNPTGIAPCIVYPNKQPLRLDCQEIRLAPLMSTPCIKLNKSRDGGMLEDGSYQAYIAYLQNEQRVSDYIGISNIQTLWNHDDNSCGLDITVSELDKRFDNFQLVLLIRNQGQLFRKIIGIYSTEVTDINIDFIDPSLVSESAESLFFISPSYEKSQSMFVVNDWLIRQGPSEQFDFNYQPIANNIITQFVVNQVPSNYYNKAGNKMGFMRDEQYAFFIRWIYNTGERSASYHIPGRAPQNYTLPSGTSYQEDELIVSSNSINVIGTEEHLFEIYNTGVVTQSLNTPMPDGSSIIAKGYMGYWQSTERYPNNPQIWGSLCGEYIRHHKMPSEQTGGNQLYLSQNNGDTINILGVEFSNIGRPLLNDGVTYIPNVVGYEILRGSRLGAKSILAKGMFKNMRKYDVPDNDNLIGGNIQGLYANYPYNDLRDDVYFSQDKTEGCDDGIQESVSDYPALTGFTEDVFSFHSPDLMFTRPFLNANETKMYGEINGNSSGGFIPSENHPGQKLLRGLAALLSGFVGLGYSIRQLQGTPDTRALPVQAINNAYPEWKIEGKKQTGGGGSVTTASVPPVVVLLNSRSGGQIDGDNNEKGGGAYTGAGDNIQDYYNNATSGGSGWLNVVTQFLSNTWGSLTDLVTGKSTTDEINDLAIENIETTQSFGEGFMGGGAQQGIVRDSADSNLPKPIRIAIGFLLTQKNIAIGGQEVVDLIYNLTSFHQYALKYNSHGFYSNFSPILIDDKFRTRTQASNYLGSSFQTFDNNQYKINNLFRPDYVAISTADVIDHNYSVTDKSRFVAGGYINDAGTGVDPSDFTERLLNPEGPFKEPISAMYGALKFDMDNQYGQLDGIKQIQMRGCVEKLDPTLPDTYMYTSQPIFSGDVFIGRYTEKCIMPIFTDFMMGQYDGFPYDYSLRVNLPYPRFWMDTKKYDISALAQAISTAGLSTLLPGSSPLAPNDLFYLDRGVGTCSALNVFQNIFAGDDLNEAFNMVHAYMYTHVNGVNDFLVETEINIAYRDWEEPKEKRFYDTYVYNDLVDLFHAEIQKFDNYYKYDESLTPAKFQSQITTFGQIQPRNYDPSIAETCFTVYPKRLIYSLQAQDEAKKDFWRVFLPMNYKDFKGEVSVIKPFSKSGAVIFFPYLSPQLFQGVDQLKTMTDTKLTIGDGGLFSQPFQNIANADISNEYGSCESLRSVMNTPAGLFYISQAQGKIFQYAPNGGLTPISNLGMKFWFSEYLPSSLIKQFPDLEASPLSDNPVVGIGCQTVYDANDDIVYFMKRDYKVKSQHIAQVAYTGAEGFILDIGATAADGVPITLGDPIYFDDCSWTISYDPKTKAWISFHDWHPELSLPSINHFFTTKTTTTTIPQCPPGYNFNPTTGLCEQGSNYNAPSNVDVSELASIITGGSVDCLIDIVIAMDVSGSTGTPDYTPMQFDAQGNVIPGTGILNNTSRATAQLRWLDVFLNNNNIVDGLASDNIQIGLTAWARDAVWWTDPGGTTPQPNPSMSNDLTGSYACNWVTVDGYGLTDGSDTNAQVALQPGNPTGSNSGGAFTLLNNKVGSDLSAAYPARSQSPFFRQVMITVTDGTSGTQANSNQMSTMQSSNVIAGSSQFVNTGSWAAANLNSSTKQECFGVFCGANANWQGSFSSTILDSVTNTEYNTTTNTPGQNQFTMNAQQVSELDASADAVAGAVCSIPFVCTCPTGYTKVFLDSATGFYNSLTSATDSCDAAYLAGTPPICRKVECSCDTGGIIIGGTCPDTPPEIYSIGDPAWIDPDPALCNYNTFLSTPPNYSVSSFWRHNVRCDLFSNFYGTDYPWEIDLISNTGQSVNTIRSIEYQLETYVYKGTMGNACGGDAYEDLNFNFDQATIYNNEQVSGLLLLNMSPYNDPWNELTYPIVGSQNINVLADKVEHKFRLNQFWDITNDRGEFTNSEQPVWGTSCNGYVRTLNSINLNYNKPETQRKKFRHYSNHVLLRRMQSGNKKMLLRLNNTKLNLSQR